jgi:hypothetical protein
LLQEIRFIVERRAAIQFRLALAGICRKDPLGDLARLVSLAWAASKAFSHGSG